MCSSQLLVFSWIQNNASTETIILPLCRALQRTTVARVDTCSLPNAEPAILFLCEVDNIAFALGVSERLRARVETEGRVTLSDDELNALARTKAVHIGLFIIFIPGSIWIAHDTKVFAACVVAAMPMWLGGLVECVWPPGSPSEACKRIATRVAEMFFTVSLLFTVMPLFLF